MNSLEQVKSMMKRIKTSSEGPEFIEYLNDLSKDNYKAFVRGPSEMNELHKGYAFAIDSLIDLFNHCDKEVIIPKHENTDWT